MFRRDNITTVVRDTYKAVKAIRPAIQVSAAVLKNSVFCRESVGQDWELWCRNGWLDFICPMSYFESNYAFESATKAQIPFTHGVPMYQGIGITLRNGTDPVLKAAEQIEIVRKYKLPGFSLFEFKPATISVMSARQEKPPQWGQKAADRPSVPTNPAQSNPQTDEAGHRVSFTAGKVRTPSVMTAFRE